jgi:hypothetical protein
VPGYQTSRIAGTFDAPRIGAARSSTGTTGLPVATTASRRCWLSAARWTIARLLADHLLRLAEHDRGDVEPPASATALSNSAFVEAGGRAVGNIANGDETSVRQTTPGANCTVDAGPGADAGEDRHGRRRLFTPEGAVVSERPDHSDRLQIALEPARRRSAGPPIVRPPSVPPHAPDRPPSRALRPRKDARKSSRIWLRTAHRRIHRRGRHAPCASVRRVL